MEKSMRRIANTGMYETTEDMRVNIGPFQWIDIPKGTMTNYASVPNSMKRFIDVDAKDIAMAALVHDCLVGEFHPPLPIKSTNQANKGTMERYPTWKRSAKIFKRLMKETGTPAWKRSIFYTAVRIKGKMAGYN